MQNDAITPIIAVDRKARRPLHQQIYDSYRQAILGGTLRPGQRIPSTRSLATELGVSRMPVLNAYAQLMAEGYFQARSGAGTVISLSLPEERFVSLNTITARTPSRSRRLARHSSVPSSIDNPPWRRQWGAFAIGQVASEQFPVREWNRMVMRASRNLWSKPQDYTHPLGVQELREAIASYLRTARSVHCEAEQIMIVNGSQHALDISARVLLDPGSRVWVEEPGYRYGRYALALNRCKLLPVPVDEEGLDVEFGTRRCPNARAALVTPSHQYPLGMTMSASRRLNLLDWAARSGAWILEDDFDSEYRYDGMPISSLQGLDPNQRVIYIGTLSKILFPSLRMGYMVIPADLVEHFITLRVAMDIGPSTFSQHILAGFIKEGHFSRHVRRMRLLYRERRNALVENIEKYFGESVTIIGEQAGMHICVLVNGVSDREVVARAARAGLSLVALSSCYMGKGARQGLILGFGSVPANKMAGAVRKLAAAVAG
ncbi:MAG TPA: PLP-dependent aminotransferase family protein [Terriglobales bacterium]|nr:PLP-dependent aminotransferase family protein [Terriglobales bacterium]